MKNYMKMIKGYLHVGGVGLLLSSMALGCGNDHESKLEELEGQLKGAREAAKEALAKVEEFQKNPPKGEKGESGKTGEKGEKGGGWDETRATAIEAEQQRIEAEQQRIVAEGLALEGEQQALEGRVGTLETDQKGLETRVADLEKRTPPAGPRRSRTP